MRTSIFPLEKIMKRGFVCVCVCVCFSILMMLLLNQQTMSKVKRMKDGESGRKSGLKRWTKMTGGGGGDVDGEKNGKSYGKEGKRRNDKRKNAN